MQTLSFLLLACLGHVAQAMQGQSDMMVSRTIEAQGALLRTETRRESLGLKCTSMTCPTGWRLKSDCSTRDCVADPCTIANDKDECCEIDPSAAAATCDSFTCPSEKLNPCKVQQALFPVTCPTCATSTCTDAECCKTRATCSADACSAGWVLKDNVATQACLSNPCNPALDKTKCCKKAAAAAAATCRNGDVTAGKGIPPYVSNPSPWFVPWIVFSGKWYPICGDGFTVKTDISAGVEVDLGNTATLFCKKLVNVYPREAETAAGATVGKARLVVSTGASSDQIGYFSGSVSVGKCSGGDADLTNCTGGSNSFAATASRTDSDALCSGKVLEFQCSNQVSVTTADGASDSTAESTVQLKDSSCPPLAMPAPPPMPPSGGGGDGDGDGGGDGDGDDSDGGAP